MRIVNVAGLVSFTLGVIAAAAAACSADDQVKLGPPNGLADKHPTDDQGDAANPTPVTTADGAVVVSNGCTPPAATLAADCPTFTKDIWTMMQGDGGPWGCTTATCHGPGANPPTLIDPSSAYDTLKAWTTTGTNAYINPACTELNKSSFDCNVVANPQACGGRMPQTGVSNHLPLAAESAKLEKWIGCGSPK